MEDWMRQAYKDKALEPRARQLCGVIAARFSNGGDRASFFDSDAIAFIDLTVADVARLRKQLEAKGYLRKAPSAGNGKPRYQLCFGYNGEVV